MRSPVAAWNSRSWVYRPFSDGPLPDSGTIRASSGQLSGPSVWTSASALRSAVAKGKNGTSECCAKQLPWKTRAPPRTSVLEHFTREACLANARLASQHDESPVSGVDVTEDEQKPLELRVTSDERRIEPRAMPSGRVERPVTCPLTRPCFT